MPTIDLGIFDHAVFLLLVAVSPWNARRRFRALTTAIDRGDPMARTRSYRTVVAEKWLRLAAIAVAWIALSRSAASIGLTWEVSTLAIVGYALTALAIGVLVMLARSALRTDQGRRRTRESIDSLRGFVPHTAAERRWYNAVSVTAGIEEEIVFRGFLFAYFAGWWSGSPAAVMIVLAGLVFGIGHLYQGAAGVVRAGSLGILFGVIYWMTGSVWAPMLLHAAVDLTSGWMTWQIVRAGGLDEAAEPAAV